MATADASRVPVAADSQSASPDKVTLAEDSVEGCFVQYTLDRMIGDKTYDTHPHHQRLDPYFVTELIALYRTNRKVPNNQHEWSFRRH